MSNAKIAYAVIPALAVTLPVTAIGAFRAGVDHGSDHSAVTRSEFVSVSPFHMSCSSDACAGPYGPSIDLIAPEDSSGVALVSFSLEYRTMNRARFGIELQVPRGVVVENAISHVPASHQWSQVSMSFVVKGLDAGVPAVVSLAGSVKSAGAKESTLDGRHVIVRVDYK